MATLRNCHCLGCGDDLKTRAGDRRVMTSLSTQKIVPDWKEMMKKTLEKWNKTADLDAELADPSYICRKCFGLFERYRRQKNTILASLQFALAHMPTVKDSHVSAEAGPSTTAKRAREDDQNLPSAKRPAFRPSYGEQSPSVQVSAFVL